jgi:hypothetical protein
MAQKHYYEAHEPLAAEFREWFKQASKARNLMIEWCKSIGAGCGFAESSLRVVFYPAFETPPDAADWKPAKGTPADAGYYEPRRTTKRGRELAAQMRDLCTLHPSGDTIAKRIKMQTFGYYDGALRWTTPGMRQVGKRILLAVPHDYEVPKELAGAGTPGAGHGQLQRLSDLEYEAIINKSKTKGVRKPAKAKRKSQS